MSDIIRLFQAFLAPALFVSATAILVLSINDRLQEAEAYTEQINSIENRAEMIRRCFVLVLISLAGSIAACLLLGFGVYWRGAAFADAAVFVVALISLFAGTIYYIREV